MEFEFSSKVKDLQKRLTAFMEEHIYPNEAKYKEHCHGADRWQPVPVIEELKPKARAAGLWNLFLPASEHGAGLTNLEYAPLVRDHGPLAVGSGGIQLLGAGHRQHGSAGTLRVARAERKVAQAAAGGRNPLLLRDDRARVASSDATNIESSIVRDGDHYVINGRKWWSSGAGDPRCKVAIFMGKTDPVGAEAQAAVHDRGADGRAGRTDQAHAHGFRIR